MTRIVGITSEYSGEPTLGARVKWLRERLGVSQADLARAAGYKTQVSMWRIEDGKVVDPGADVLAKIAKTLGTSIDWLVTGADAATSQSSHVEYDELYPSLSAFLAQPHTPPITDAERAHLSGVRFSDGDPGDGGTWQGLLDKFRIRTMYRAQTPDPRPDLGKDSPNVRKLEPKKRGR